MSRQQINSTWNAVSIVDLWWSPARPPSENEVALSPIPNVAIWAKPQIHFPHIFGCFYVKRRTGSNPFFLDVPFWGEKRLPGVHNLWEFGTHIHLLSYKQLLSTTCPIGLVSQKTARPGHGHNMVCVRSELVADGGNSSGVCGGDIWSGASTETEVRVEAMGKD